MNKYWKVTSKNGKLSEGYVSNARRIMGMIFLGEVYEDLSYSYEK